MTEVWKDIKGYEQAYQVSNLGGVRSVDRDIETKNGRTQRHKGVTLNPRMTNSGYLYVSFRSPSLNKNFYVHRLVSLAFIPNPENKKTVNHRDGVKTNNCLTNLEWNTHSENGKHAYLMGLSNPKGLSGEESYSKLTNENVLDIRALKGEVFQRILAERYNVARSTISAIQRGVTWKHIN